MPEVFDVAIGGGGFTGLALARTLALSLGDEARIILVDPGTLENDRLQPSDGRAITLSASSVHLLSAIGIWPGLVHKAQPVRAIDITDTSLESTARLPVLSYGNQLADQEPAAFVIENRPLMGALTEAVRSNPAIQVLTGRSITQFLADDTGVAVTLDDGATFRSTALVAADGRNSKLRAAAGIKSVGWSYDQDGIITIVDHELPHNGRACQHFLPSGPFAILPLPGEGAFQGGGRSCVTWSESSRRAREIMRSDDTGFLTELERRFGTTLGKVARAAPRSSYPLALHLARTFIAPRFVLVGDAARTVHPIAGQGLNLALRDVAALAEVMTDAASLGLDIGSGAVLERYERWRRFDSVASAASMDALNRLFSSDWVLLRALRSAGAGVVDRLPSLKHHLVRQAAGLAGEVPRLMRGGATGHPASRH